MLESLLLHTSQPIQCISLFGIDTGFGCTSGFGNVLSIILTIAIVASTAFCSFKLVEKYLTPPLTKKLPHGTGKISLASQVFFVFIPILNFWAFYRMKKLRKYVGFVTLPSVIAFYFFGFALAGLFLFGFSLFLVLKWSRKHNRQFDQTSNQAQS